MIAKHYFTLLKTLFSTCSPREHLAIVQEFLTLRGRDNEPEEIEEILAFFKEKVIIKKNQGHMSDESREKIRNKQNKKKPKKKTFDEPAFFLNYTAHQNCATCQQLIESNYAFRHKVNGEYYDYHSVPSCFPEDFKNIMQTDSKYLAKMGRSDYIRNEIIIDPVLGGD